MPVLSGAGYVIWAVTAVLLLLGVAGAFPATLKLERAFPVRGNVELSDLRIRDRARHGRLLQGVVDFPVEGSSDPFTVGLYYTSVKLGSPPKEFYVQIDTGSDILWVTCNPCDGCPKSSGLVISCSNEVCTVAIETQNALCASESGDSACNYTYNYGDGSGTKGYYVSDTLYFDTVVGNSLLANSSTSIVFGCSISQSGDLTKPERAVDGIFGFGRNELSVISQLSSHGLAPNAFSHCLKGTENGGGILVLGEVVEPGIVYTPLVPSAYHYNLNLQSIAVNGQILPIESEVFATSSNRGTIIDSGTTLAYLAEEAFDPFVTAILASLSPSVQAFVSKGNQCFTITSSVEETFPSVTLTFEGGASMILKPEDYLLQQGSVDGAMIWCIGWQRVQGQGITILGDLVLKDKIFVYDLAGQRIGWTNYDCSLSVNVSASSGKSDYVNTNQLSVSGLSSLKGSFYAHVVTFFLVRVLLFGMSHL
ncbi:aspartic proteinase 36-like isoform X2 [Aristolochia californica]|uniref:aspartic proteinase 36-like isoform X2 n=1 Tax=Aristolochia californica TaxID=171875 RepID=UPI0035D7B46E